MPSIGSLITLAAGKAYRSEVNGNFSTIRTAVNTYGVFTDVDATITATLTFSTSPAFSEAVTFAKAVTVTSDGLTVTAGGATITAGGLTVTAGASTFGAAVTVTGTCTATEFVGGGAGITGLSAAAFTTGTFGAVNGSALTNLNASNIASGTIATARLPNTITVSTAVQVPLVGGGTAQVTVNLSDTASSFLSVGASGAQMIATGLTPAGAIKYLKVNDNGTTLYIAMQAA